uniref:F-box domain-containing protein n=1 Tax=Caenorhabditis tropicalis TaxID=1561998 RepID=A0A1I7TUM6_9PELO
MTVVFPLFHLPLVAMEHVLCMMNPYELINLSLTSSRTKRRVKCFTRTKEKFEAELSIDQKNPNISIDPEGESWGYTWTSDKSNICYEAKIFLIGYETLRFAEKPIEELMKWYDYVNEVLSCKCSTFCVDLDCCPKQNRLIADWISSRHNSVSCLRIEGKGKQCSEDIKYLLSNIKCYERLLLFMTNIEDNFEAEIPEGCEYLHVKDAKFIEYEQFLRLKHKEITLLQSILTNQDLNRFLKSWIAYAMQLLMDIPYEVTTDPNIIERFKWYPFNSDVTSGYNIRRSDGTVATLCVTKVENLWHLVMIIY